MNPFNLLLGGTALTSALLNRRRQLLAPSTQTASQPASQTASTQTVAQESTLPPVQGPVQPVTNEGVNLSYVPEEFDLVPDMSSFTMPTSSSLPQFSPLPYATQSQTASNDFSHTNEINRLLGEIRTVEQRMAGREGERADAYDQSGVWEDMRRLNELNASLREAQDRQIEVPLEARQQLRGRGATMTEFAQTTAPQLEQAALQELTLSRQASRITEETNLKMAQIDQRINAEKEADEQIYQFQNNYLNQLQTAYSNIISGEQAMALEERKFNNELALYQSKREIDMRGDVLNSIAAKGGSIAGLENASISDLLTYDVQLQTPEEQARQESVEGQALWYADFIQGILDNPSGLSGSVGVGLGSTRISSIDALLTPGQVNQFRDDVQRLGALETLEYFAGLKERDLTFGALSEKELDLIQSGALNLGLITGKDGQLTGRSYLSEDVFRQRVREIQTIAQKDFIASQIGAEAYRRGNYKDAAPEAIAAKFQELRANPTQQTTNPHQQIFAPQAARTGNLPQRNNNPGNVKAGGLADQWAVGRDNQGHLIFPTPEIGFQALAADLGAKITGRSAHVSANPTIAQLGRVYAEDSNWPNSVSRILGVSPETRTGDVNFNNLVMAIARQEGFFA